MGHTTIGLVVALVMAVGLASIGAGSAAAATDGSTVAKTAAGKMTSKVIGRTSDGRAVTGSFTPTRVVKKAGKMYVKGFLEGAVKNPDGSKTTFSGLKKMTVKKLNGQALAAGALTPGSVNKLAACNILNLVLGPLDLNLLGLEIHLQRVVLDIIAVPGPGNLLGNLLCAIAGLLDGGPLGGLLGQLSALLNRILGLLNLGV
ncbi:hypothetical protein [Nocardioides sp. LHG3406-4]|uniref:hypothetical protein n=1 Tax=Nocardioides sp. LHG3406-4 TaxID=2804575 RepID=UPI003CFB26D0